MLGNWWVEWDDLFLFFVERGNNEDRLKKFIKFLIGEIGVN